MLEKIAEELHEARLKSGITLQQMAGKTRVDIKFLEAIDNGDFTFLSEPYVKAFIKDFAKMVGLDENKIILKYEAAKQGKLSEDIEEEKKSVVDEKREEPKPLQKYDATSPGSPDNSKKTINPKIRLYGAIGVIFIFVLLFIYLIFFKSSSEIVVAEKPIEEVIKDSQQRFVPEEKPKQEVTTVTQQQDSLTLNILASDTSWVKIILDDKSEVEFILFPKSQKSIKALDDYKITLGNAGAIKFQMNDKPLNFSAKAGSVTHVQINKSGLTYLKSPPILNSPTNE
jgi:cytoskeletal protein RodZ